MFRSCLLSTISILALSMVAQPIAAFAADADDFKLEEVTVTARKSTESLLTVPVAVTAISAADIEARGIRDALYDVASYTPGFTFQNQTGNRNDRGFKAFIVRGINPNSPNAPRQAATVFVDGVPINGGNIGGVSEIERVEIVKGPQSAYFGRATFAGAINYITRQPGNEFGASADVNLAEWGTQDVALSVEGPLVADKLSARLSGSSQHTDGQYTNIMFPKDEKLGKRDTKSIAAAFSATPTDQLHAKAFINVWRDDDGPAANSQINVNNGFNCNAGGAPAGTLNYVCGPISTAPQDTRVYNTLISPAIYKRIAAASSFDPNFLTHFGLKRDAIQAHIIVDYTFQNDYVLSGNAQYDKSKWAFLTDTVFRDTRNVPNANFGTIADVLPYYSRTAFSNQLDRDHGGEVRLTSPRSDRFKWMVGANYQYIDNRSNLISFGTTGLLFASPEQYNTARTLGVFGSATYEIGGGFSVIAEARVQSDKLYQEQVVAKITAQDTFNSFTPRVIVQYQPTTDFTVYASYAEGTRPGSFNTGYLALTAAQQAQVRAATSVGLAVPEERMRMGELGAKGMFLDGRLRVLADIYYGYWKNRLVPSFVNLLAPDGSFQQQTNVNVGGGEAKLKGFELEMEARVLPELTLEGTFNIADSKIVTTVCSDCRLITGSLNPVGTQFQGYPRVKGSLSGTYQRPVADDLDGYIRVDYIYTGKIYDTEANIAYLVPTSKINLHVGVERGKTRFEIYGKNITDNRVPTGFARNTDNLTGGNAISLSLADKATYGVRLTTKF